MKTSGVKLRSRLRESNLRTYNGKMLHRYDYSFWVKFWTQKWDNEIISELGDNLPSMNILDVGCATGRLLCSLAGTGAQNLAGTDIAPKIVELAGANLSKMGITADLRVSDAEGELPWKSSHFNAVTMTGVMHHFFMPLLALSEVFRILKQGGKLIIIEPRFITPLRQIINLYLRFFSHEGDCRFYSRCQAEELLRECGFSSISSSKVTFHSFIVSAVKD
jgi:ubiquinone/menaquinone biosynthesis C-methylase UbiE